MIFGRLGNRSSWICFSGRNRICKDARAWLFASVRHKRLELIRNGTWILLRKNMMCHTPILVREFNTSRGITLRHDIAVFPPISPDRSSYNSILFTRMTNLLSVTPMPSIWLRPRRWKKPKRTGSKKFLILFTNVGRSVRKAKVNILKAIERKSKVIE